MLNIHELEKKWKVYKIKSYMPYIIIVSLLLISAILFTFKTSIVHKETPSLVKQQVKKEEINSKKEQKTQHKPISTKNEKNDKLVLQPSLNFMSNIKHSSISNEYDYHSYKKPKKVETQTKKTSKLKKVVEEPIKQKKEIKSHLKIKRQNTQDDINHVLKRFNKNNDPALSLFVAKKYYELGKYHKSYNFALITNEINDNIDESWIIFAKSLVKLNKKEKAISTLKQYIQHSDSNKAKILLEEITSGKFK